MENKKQKIVIVGLKNNNLGDRVILDTCKYLVANCSDDIEISIMNLFPSGELMKKYKTEKSCFDVLLKYCKKNSYLVQMFTFLKWWFAQKRKTKIYRYYKNNLFGAAGVIFAGGGLIKHSRENFWDVIYSILTICDRRKIPVYFDAIGVEGFDANNFNSQLLKYSLNKNCVKKITTRDDIVSLKKYITDEKKVDVVGDPALWTNEIYDISNIKKTDIVGVGVVRGKIFTDYGFDFTEEQILDAYVGIIKKLEEKGHKWQLFCNGIISDYKMGEAILEKLNLPTEEKYLAKRPESAEQLVQQIYSYKAIIAARLHANIIATAYRIPSVGFVWNDKLTMFGELINRAEFFLDEHQFSNAEYVVNMLEKSISVTYEEETLTELKAKSVKHLQDFLCFCVKIGANG